MMDEKPEKNPDDFEEINRVKKTYARELMQKANVVGLASGFKEVAKQKTQQPALIIFVKKKMPICHLLEQDRLPAELENVLLDVVEVGDVKLQD